MSMISINVNPSERELRWFGVLFAAASGVLGGVIWLKTGRPFVPEVIWGVGLGLAAQYYLVPGLRRLLYRSFVYATFPIGLVVSTLLVYALFYLVFTPVGLLLRLFGKDPMNRRLDRAARTYWIARPATIDQRRYLRQS